MWEGADTRTASGNEQLQCPVFFFLFFLRMVSVLYNPRHYKPHRLLKVRVCQCSGCPESLVLLVFFALDEKLYLC